ncbi:hypothetical protein UCMB321_3147 [Pseudomonas batumici]|uniref:Uncharacterized protein n=1 Tax=Pseudomonas batumici TaxID=226910 RepID=A0A0C2IE23_9PSED|nr:hypothetical protein UCMB321_3147 [Pseudomonas batumici]
MLGFTGSAHRQLGVVLGAVCGRPDRVFDCVHNYASVTSV